MCARDRVLSVRLLLHGALFVLVLAVQQCCDSLHANSSTACISQQASSLSATTVSAFSKMHATTVV
jgi:hypothetical protein